MRVDKLKELLSMYPDDTEVMLQTTPDDLASPVTMKSFSLWKASHDARYGLEPEKLVLTAFIPSQPCKPPAKEAQIKSMVDRFLSWRLPKPWNPDNGISYQRPNYAHEPAEHDWPTGTNLFDAGQAESMIRYMLNL